MNKTILIQKSNFGNESASWEDKFAKLDKIFANVTQFEVSFKALHCCP